MADEAPSTYPYGFEVLIDLAYDLRVSSIVHGHLHQSCTVVTTHGIKGIELGRAEILVVGEGHLR